MVKFIKYLITLLIVTIGLPLTIWGGGFIIFSGAVFLMQAPEEPEVTDAAIVLTGGTNRINKGLDLLANKKTTNLLVSGVHKDVEIKDLMELWGEKEDVPPCCITLGREAENTIGNAVEAKKWVDHLGAKTVTLITSNYHMPRALLEFHHELPDIKVIPYPVRPTGFDPEKESFWKLEFIEYHKLLMTIVRIVLYPQEKQPLPESLKNNTL